MIILEEVDHQRNFNHQFYNNWSHWEKFNFDPSFEEEQVLENGLIISFYNNKVITPISNTNFAVNSNNSNFKGLDQSLLIQSLTLCNKYCPNIIRALDSLIEEDNDDNDGSIF